MMFISIYSMVFFVFAATTIVAALMVILLRNPVHSALFLILTFFTVSVLWMMLEAEFLALALIFVYVGAVMTLFLFVVMMLKVKTLSFRESFSPYLPFGLVVMVLLLGLMLWVLWNVRLPVGQPRLTEALYGSDTTVLGLALYTHYLYPFEIAAFILLVAMIGAISLAFFGRKKGTRSQKITAQLKATKSSRLRLVEMESEKP